MAKTISVRLDDDQLASLDALVAEEEVDRSEVIRRAIVSRVGELRRERLRRESAEIARDADDRAEMAAVAAEMEPLRAW